MQKNKSTNTEKPFNIDGQPVNIMPDLGDYRWLCEYLQISPFTARRWVMDGRLPGVIKLAGGKLVRFKKSVIADMINKEAAK